MFADDGLPVSSQSNLPEWRVRHFQTVLHIVGAKARSFLHYIADLSLPLRSVAWELDVELAQCGREIGSYPLSWGHHKRRLTRPRIETVCLTGRLVRKQRLNPERKSRRRMASNQTIWPAMRPMVIPCEIEFPEPI